MSTMSQRPATMPSFFGDDPFFSQERLLWPLHREALTSLQQEFFNRRAKLADSLLNELHNGPHSLLKELREGPHLLDLRQGAFLRSPFTRNTDDEGEGPSMELQNNVQQATGSNGDLLVTLDARGYAPNDITVKLEGRRLAVVAMKQAGAGTSQSTSSSSSSSSSFASTSSARIGFVQRIDLPAHLDLSGLSCSLMDDGQLRIDAPAAKQPIGEERQVPIRFRTSLEVPITKDNTAETHTD